MSSAAYKKVIPGGGLKFKGDKSQLTKKRIGNEKAIALERGPGFKTTATSDIRTKTEIDGEQTTPSGSAPSSSSSSSGAAAAAGSSPFVAGVGAPIAHPVVLASGSTGRSSWSLHKDELHEIDANLAALREQDRAIERMEGTSKKELIARDKLRIEKEVAIRIETGGQLPNGIKFSIPNSKVENLNKEYLFRKEANVSDATSRLDQRTKKKADRYCK